MTKYISGPYERGGPWPSVSIIYQPDPDEGNYWEPICMLWDAKNGDPPEEIVATADLLAASVDLIEAACMLEMYATEIGLYAGLYESIRNSDGWPMFIAALKRTRAAIKKAGIVK